MKKLYFICMLFLSAITLHAHTLLLNVMDNEDNTINISGAFSTGDSAAGALIRLESLVDGKILFKKRLPEGGELVTDIPKVPYQIVLDGGPGHTVIKEGIAPLEGYSTKTKDMAKKSVKLSQPSNVTRNWSKPTIILFIVGLFLLILTLYFSAKNTKKIIKAIEKSSKHN